LRADAIRSLIPEEDFISTTATDRSTGFLGDVERAAEQGFFCTEGLSHTFRYCMAAPVRDKNGQAVAALCFIDQPRPQTEQAARHAGRPHRLG